MEENRILPARELRSRRSSSLGCLTLTTTWRGNLRFTVHSDNQPPPKNKQHACFDHATTHHLSLKTPITRQTRCTEVWCCVKQCVVRNAKHPQGLCHAKEKSTTFVWAVWRYGAFVEHRCTQIHHGYKCSHTKGKPCFCFLNTTSLIL